MALQAADFFRQFVRDRIFEEPDNLETYAVLPAADEVRLLWREHIQRLDADLEHVHVAWSTSSMPRNKPKLLRGPAGAGKSCTLYALVHRALDRKWVVLYLPRLGRLLDTTNINDQAVAILENLQRTNRQGLPADIAAIVEAGLGNKSEALHALKNALSALKTQTRVPFLLALDQWNVVQGAPNDSLIGTLFRPFDALKVTLGASIAAVSSSFQAPVGLFRDADLQQLTVRVPLYTEDEFLCIFTDLRARGQLPPPDAGLTMESLHQMCGNVPRMISFVEQVWSESRRTGTWTQTETYRFHRNAVEYYSHRVESVLARARVERPDQQRELERFAALVYLNKHTGLLNSEQIPSGWEWSGLFDTSMFPPEFACPSVGEAFYRVLSKPSSQVLNTLAAHPNTSGTAYR